MAAQISLAGRIVVEAGGQQVDERDLPGAQARLVLSLLVCHRERAIARDELAANLWPEQRPATWHSALRGIVVRVRAFLVAAGLGDRDIVQAGAGAYQLALPPDTSVDLERAVTDMLLAERELRAGDPAPAAELAGRARAVLSRPLLPGVEAPWVEGKRRELGLLHLQALQTVAEARLRVGDHRHAVSAAEELIGLDAFREPAHRVLMRAHLAVGDTAAGLRAHERCRQLLATELGVDPSPETQALHATLLRDTEPVRPVAAGGPPSLSLPEPAELPPPGHDRPLTVATCPYVGLRTFEESDARWFFGRTADVSRLLERLDGSRFLAVVGPSGSGKSSLVRAGVVPALRSGSLPGSDTWAIRVLRPGPAPVAALAAALATLDEPGTGNGQPAADRREAIERQLGARPEALTAAVEASPARRVVLVVDQLEEVFTVCGHAAERRAFLDALAVGAARGDRLSIVITIRADRYPRLAEFPRLADHASARHFLVTPLDEVGLAEAITGPARAAGLSLDDGLVDEILSDVARQPGALPLLGHCLVELWERRDGDTLTLKAYRDAGGVRGALAQRAEAVYQAMSVREQTVARRVLLRLTRPDHSGGTRHRVPVAELAANTVERDAVEAVVSRLSEARLLTCGGPPVTERWAEVSHEALVIGWPRLRAWVEEDRAGLLVHGRLTAATDDWHRLGRDEAPLYRGAQLAEAMAWAERHPDDPNARERAFLDASRAAAEAGRHRRVRRLRLVTALLTVGLVLVATLGAVALVQQRRAEEQQRLAVSRAVAAEAVNQLALDPALGLALAVEAVELLPTREAIAALRQALITPQARLAVPGGRSDFAVDPTGRLLVVGDADGTARVWDLESGELIHALDGHAGLVLVTAFSPDGSLLAVADEEGVRVWEVADGTLWHVLPHGTGVFAVAWTPDGRRLATSGSAAEVRIWDVGSGTVSATAEAPVPVSFVRLAPDAQTALVWTARDPELYVLDLGSGRTEAVLDGHEAPAVDARISPDGRHAVSVGLDGTARLWDLQAAAPLAVVDGLADQVWVGRFSPDGRRVLVGDATGTVRVVGVPDGLEQFSRRAHADAVVGAAFDPEGALAATVSLDGTALVWDLDAGRPRTGLTLDGAASLGIGLRSVTFTPDGTQLVTRASSVQVWDVPEAALLSVAAHDRPVSVLELSGDVLATGGADYTVRMWDLADGSELRSLAVPELAVTALAFSPGASTLVSANPSESGIAETTAAPTVWDVATGQAVGTVPVPEPTRRPCPRVCQTNAIAYRPDGVSLLTAGQEGVVRRWDATSGELLETFEAVELMLRSVVSSPDGRWVAAAGWRRALIWEATSGDLAHSLPAPALAVHFSSDGVLAVGGDDGTASLWDPATGELVGALRHGSAVTDVAWSTDGRFLLTAVGDGARLWDAGAQQQIQAFTGHGGVRAVAFTTDDRIVLGDADGAFHVHRCAMCGEVDDLIVQARAQSVRPLTPTERERFLAVEP